MFQCLLIEERDLRELNRDGDHERRRLRAATFGDAPVVTNEQRDVDEIPRYKSGPVRATQVELNELNFKVAHGKLNQLIDFSSSKLVCPSFSSDAGQNFEKLLARSERLNVISCSLSFDFAAQN